MTGDTEVSWLDIITTVTIPSQTNIRSTKMAILYYTLLLGAFVYMLLELLFVHRYAEFVPARAFFNVWQISFRNKSNPLPSYCNNDTFNWLLSPEAQAVVGPFMMQNLSCAWFADGEVTEVKNSGWAMAWNMFPADVVTGETMPNVLVTDVDKILVNVQHTLWTPDGGDLNPETELVDYTGKVVRTIQNQFVQLTIPEIFALIGKDYESVNPTDVNLGAQVPDLHFLNSGMNVVVVFTYSNLRTWSMHKQNKCRIQFLLQEGQWGVMGWAISQGKTYSRYGLTLNFIVNGEVGAFSVYNLVLHFISSFVLLTIAKTVIYLAIKVGHMQDQDFARALHEEVLILDGSTSRGGSPLFPGETQEKKPLPQLNNTNDEEIDNGVNTSADAKTGDPGSVIREEELVVRSPTPH